MTGVKLNFSTDVPSLDFTQTVTQFDATVQNAMVNLGTLLGSDSLFPDRGTYLLNDAVSGGMINLQWANNFANFAAVRTMVFSKNNAAPGDEYGLQNLSLKASVFNINRLQLFLTATCVDGETRGVSATM